MKIYATSDTHFGHDKLVELSGRPIDFGDRLLKNIKQNSGDLLIHCGDFCIKDDVKHTERFMEAAKGFKKKVLVRGNHDNKSDSWYYSQGWDFVCRSMALKIFGKHVVFTHAPIGANSILVGEEQTNYYMNIHGHLHGEVNRHSAQEFYNHKFNYDLAPETHDYKIVKIEDIIK